MRRYRALALTAAALAFASIGRAQTTGGISGWISDSLGAPLPGVTVEAAGASLPGRRTAVTGKDGAYRLPALPPGRYVVRASLPGFATVEKAAAVAVDATSTVRMILQVAQRETVFVSSDEPFVNSTSTTIGKSYPTGLVVHLPVDRNYADAVYEHPGAVTDQGASQGRSTSLAVNGSTSAESEWTIDGVNATNVMLGVQGKAFNNEAIEEVQVVTGGFPAEYGRFLGGMINVVTKSGGNEWHGGAFVYYDSSQTSATRSFGKNADSPRAGMRLADYDRTDWGASLGGYLWKDRLWFFGAYDRTSLSGDVSPFVTTELVDPTMQFPLDGVDQLFSVKLTGNLSNGSMLTATVFSDPTTNTGAGAADPRRSDVVFRQITNPDAGTWNAERRIGATDYGLRLDQVLGPSAFVNFQAARHQDRFRLDAPEGGDIPQITDFTCGRGGEACFVEGGFGDLGGPGNNSESYRNQFRADLNLYRGAHEIKVGADYQNAHTTALNHYSGDQLVERHRESGAIIYKHDFFTLAPGSEIPAAGISRGGIHEVGAYVQDSWRAAPGLTINAGLRWDEERLRDYRDVTVMRMSDEWQPRLGVAWDPWKDGATKIFAFAGRFYYSLPTTLAVQDFGGVYRGSTWNYDPTDVTPQDVPGHDNLPSGLYHLVALVEDHLRGTSLDEVTLGVERLVAPSWSVGLTATYRSLHSAVEDRCDLDVRADNGDCAITNAGGSGTYARGEFYSCNQLDPPYSNCEPDDPLNYGAPQLPAAKRIYRGIQLLTRKSLSDRLMLQASVVYSSLRGNYDGAVNEGFFQTSPGANLDFDYPELYVNDSGRLFLDRPIDVRMSGFYRTPWNVSIGLDAYVISGPPLERFGYLNNHVGTFPVRVVPRGEAGRLPTQWEASLTLEYPMRIGPAIATIQAYVFNLFNNQIATGQDMVWSDTSPTGYPDTLYNQPQTNDNYGKATSRQAPRLFRAALRVSF